MGTFVVEAIWQNPSNQV